MWVATEWDFFVEEGGRSCLVHSVAKAKTGNSFGVKYTQI